jgi:heme/copper-type cytochrome/quinol oxidase subunit 2
METPDILNSKSVKKYVKNSFVIMGLFIVLSFVFAIFTIIYCKNLTSNTVILIYIYTIIPLLIFGGLIFLMKQHLNKLYGSSKSKNKENRTVIPVTPVITSVN